MRATTLLSRRSDRFVLYDVDWAFYQSILKQIASANQHAFVTYYRGTLELMSPSYPHDRIARLLCRLVHTLAEELDVPIASAGTTTWRRKIRRAGLEADESFFLHSEPMIRGKSKIDLRRDPPPDLVIEVEVSRRMVGMRMRAYAKLGVPEVWRYRLGKLRFMLLQSNGRYVEPERSPTFPQVRAEDLARFVESGLVGNETESIRDFRAWVRKNVVPQRRP